MIFQRLIIATAVACLVHDKEAHGFVRAPHLATASSRHGAVNGRSSSAMGASEIAMPEALEEFGVDEDLWKTFPLGAHKDISRFCRTGHEDLAKNRIATMKEILEFVEGDGAWEEAKWQKGVIAWEKLQLDVREAEVARIKAEKKAKREAVQAKKKAEAEAAAAAAGEGDEFQ